MTINKPYLCTNIYVWAPRYKKWSTTKRAKELEVLIANYKIVQASPIFILHFSKANHLKGARFCIKRDTALTFPIEQMRTKTGARIPMRVIPLSAFEPWESGEEVSAIANNIFEDLEL